jgi:hypothetical protein
VFESQLSLKIQCISRTEVNEKLRETVGGERNKNRKQILFICFRFLFLDGLFFAKRDGEKRPSRPKTNLALRVCINTYVNSRLRITFKQASISTIFIRSLKSYVEGGI